MIKVASQLQQSVRVVVNQLCHEKIANACDLGSAKVQLSQKFPTLCFDEVNDLWWYRPSKHINLHNYKQLWKENAYKEDLGMSMNDSMCFQGCYVSSSCSLSLVVSNLFLFPLHCSLNVPCDSHVTLSVQSFFSSQ